MDVPALTFTCKSGLPGCANISMKMKGSSTISFTHHEKFEAVIALIFSFSIADAITILYRHHPGVPPASDAKDMILFWQANFVYRGSLYLDVSEKKDFESFASMNFKNEMEFKFINRGAAILYYDFINQKGYEAAQAEYERVFTGWTYPLPESLRIMRDQMFRHGIIFPKDEILKDFGNLDIVPTPYWDTSLSHFNCHPEYAKKIYRYGCGFNSFIEMLKCKTFEIQAEDLYKPKPDLKHLALFNIKEPHGSKKFKRNKQEVNAVSKHLRKVKDQSRFDGPNNFSKRLTISSPHFNSNTRSVASNSTAALQNNESCQQSKPLTQESSAALLIQDNHSINLLQAKQNNCSNQTGSSNKMSLLRDPEQVTWPADRNQNDFSEKSNCKTPPNTVSPIIFVTDMKANSQQRNVRVNSGSESSNEPPKYIKLPMFILPHQLSPNSLQYYNDDLPKEQSVFEYFPPAVENNTQSLDSDVSETTWARSTNRDDLTNLGLQKKNTLFPLPPGLCNRSPTSEKGYSNIICDLRTLSKGVFKESDHNDEAGPSGSNKRVFPENDDNKAGPSGIKKHRSR
uniref:RGS domain-containing protein n=1 Tax=Rhabditophanes sp. KR3021 TaxID=114890 RepID=A0AC35TL42_9BILA